MSQHHSLYLRALQSAGAVQHVQLTLLWLVAKDGTCSCMTQLQCAHLHVFLEVLRGSELLLCGFVRCCLPSLSCECVPQLSASLW